MLNRAWSEAECPERVRDKSRRPAGMPQWLMLCPVPQNRPSATQLLYIIVYPTTPLRSMAGYFQRALTGSDWENMT